MKKILPPYFVDENEDYAYGGKIAYDESPDWIEHGLNLSSVGHFHANGLFIDHPAEEYAHEEAADRHEEFGYDEVKEVEHTETEHCLVGPHSERERAPRCQKHAEDGDGYCHCGTAPTVFFVEVCHNHFEHGDAGGDGGYDEEHVEEQ